MINKLDKNAARLKRHMRARKKISGTDQCPRLNVFRSKNNIYAQLIDDEKSNTIISLGTLDKEFKELEIYGGNKNAAREVGKLIAKKAINQGIEKIKFDRGGYIFHGRVKELADGAREGGLKF